MASWPFREPDYATASGIIGRRGVRHSAGCAAIVGGSRLVSTSASGIGRRYGATAISVRVVPLALGVLLLAGCTSGSMSAPPPTVSGQGPRPAEAAEAIGSGVGCPTAINQVVDTEAPATAEIILALDFSGSFIGTEPARARIRAQARALVEQSVERGQALRILAFTRTASGASTIVACPSLTARYNNVAARPRKVENLKRKATLAVDAALVSAIQTRLTQRPGSGTSIVGGFLAIEESASLVRPGTPRDAIMFSDGEGLDEDAMIDLSDFRTVSLYGVGSNANGPMDTPAAAALAEEWVQWLIKHGAVHPKASTQAMF